MILFGTFSDDTITTGISLSSLDSWWLIIDGKWTSFSTCFDCEFCVNLTTRNSYLDSSEEFVARHLRHPVIRDDQTHLVLLLNQNQIISRWILILKWRRSRLCDWENVGVPSPTAPGQSSRYPPPSLRSYTDAGLSVRKKEGKNQSEGKLFCIFSFSKNLGV